MKYYLIVGEASGDLHASHLMRSLQKLDPEAEFRFFGGDNMIAVGGTCVRHYKTIAYMGFIPVLMHLRTISEGMKQCKRDIIEWQPDVVIPVDYAGFNLSICKFLREYRDKATPPSRSRQLNSLANHHHPSPNIHHPSPNTHHPSPTTHHPSPNTHHPSPTTHHPSPNTQHPTPNTFYYISPKIWAWKEYRIKNFKRDVDEMFSILPFEIDFFEKRHNYPIHYVGNPTADEVRQFRNEYKESASDFRKRNGITSDKPIIAIMPGSRKQEIKDNLPAMLEAVSQFPDYQPVLGCAPSIDMDYYESVIPARYRSMIAFSRNDEESRKAFGSPSYALLSQSVAALVTSGTATLETSIFDVPQVVCYKTPLPRLLRWCFNHIIKCRYISLVNLIADREVVQELFADRFSVANIASELRAILPGGSKRETMLRDYDEIDRRLGNEVAPDNAARIMLQLLNKNISPNV